MSVERPENDGQRAAGLTGDRESRTELVATQIRDRIASGALRAGQPIRQEAEAQLAGVSRVPVREALRLLEAEGLVTISTNRGARVADFSLEGAVETYLMREALEPLALEQSVPRLTDEQIANLAHLEQRIRDGRTPAEILGPDREFHLGSYAAAPMPRLLTVIGTLWMAVSPYSLAMHRALTPTDMEAVYDVHRLILYSIQRRDGKAAAQVMSWHIRQGRQRLVEHAELFERNSNGASAPPAL